jgi:prolycopene isomerase
MQHLERVMPGFTEKVVVKLSASALTSQRYTLNHKGAMLGWEMSPDQLGEHRPPLNGMLKNLYFVGHWTQPGGGITPVIVSAMQVAKKIIKNGGARSFMGLESTLCQRENEQSFTHRQ